MYDAFYSESKGWMYYNWLDSFNIAVFKLSPSVVSNVLKGAVKINVKIRWGRSYTYIRYDGDEAGTQRTEGAYTFRLFSI